MQIELIGCTSAGKSWLVQNMLEAASQNGFHLVTSYDYVVSWAHFNWVKNHRIRMLVLNLIALFACLFTWRKNRSFYQFAIGLIWKLPAKVSLFEKLKIARIAARNVGIYEIVRRNRSERQVVLADEGTLHIAHYLFVHVLEEPNLSDLAKFMHLVSLPDAAVYIRQPESILISRTISRGHKRIPDDAPLLVNQFIKHSLVVFEKLVEYSTIEDRLVIVNNGEVVKPAWDGMGNPRLEFTCKLLELKPTL